MGLLDFVKSKVPGGDDDTSQGDTTQNQGTTVGLPSGSMPANPPSDSFADPNMVVGQNQQNSNAVQPANPPAQPNPVQNPMDPNAPQTDPFAQSNQEIPSFNESQRLPDPFDQGTQTDAATTDPTQQPNNVSTPSQFTVPANQATNSVADPNTNQEMDTNAMGNAMPPMGVSQPAGTAQLGPQTVAQQGDTDANTNTNDTQFINSVDTNTTDNADVNRQAGAPVNTDQDTLAAPNDAVNQLLATSNTTDAGSQQAQVAQDDIEEVDTNADEAETTTPAVPESPLAPADGEDTTETQTNTAIAPQAENQPEVAMDTHSLSAVLSGNSQATPTESGEQEDTSAPAEKTNQLDQQKASSPTPSTQDATAREDGQLTDTTSQKQESTSNEAPANNQQEQQNENVRNVLTKISLIGSEKADVGMAKDVVTTVTQAGKLIVLDSAAGTAEQIITDSTISPKLLEVIQLKPYHGAGNQSGETLPDREVSTFVYSNLIEREKHLLKEARAHVFVDISTPDAIATFSLALDAVAAYPENAKPVLVFGEQAKAAADQILAMAGIDANHIHFVNSSDELIQKLDELNNTLGAGQKMLMPRVVDRRVAGDERDFVIY